ncbi:MAG: DNA-processing protein DprA [Endomicrobiia bacterium]
MNLTETQASVLLNMIPEIGPVRANRLISYFGSAKKIFQADITEIKTSAEVTEKIAEKILRSINYFDVSIEFDKAKKLGVKIITFNDEEYPAQLKTLNDPPLVLYTKGEITEQDIYSIAIVGTRHPTEYGKTVTEKITKELSELNITIVSGLARGIDTIAHRTAINSGGRTIAVLGNGLDIYYPPENRKLQNTIENSGAVVSEFPFGTKPEKRNFPRRNRLISGLSLGTIVIECTEKSGALITAKYSAEQGKEVFAVPGSILSKYSCGPHSLIKQGAKLIENVKDILEEISILAEWIKEKVKNENISSKKDNKNYKPISPLEKRILEILKLFPQGINIETLHKKINQPFNVLSEAIISLEIKGAIKSLPGKVYIGI